MRMPRDPDAPHRQVRVADLVAEGPEAILQAVQEHGIERSKPRTHGVRRAMLRYVEEALETRNAGDDFNAAEHICNNLIQEARTDPALGMRLVEATLRAQAEAAENEEPENREGLRRRVIELVPRPVRKDAE